MKNLLVILIIIGFTACNQKVKPKAQDSVDVATITEKTDTIKKETLTKSFSEEYARFIHTDSTYKTDHGNITIQNSYPKGGVGINQDRGYADPIMNQYGYGQFWTRIINETDKTLNFSVNFPGDSINLDAIPEHYFKLLVSPKKIELSMLALLNYGYEISEVASFLDANFGRSTQLEKSIAPHEEHMFFVTMLIHYPNNGPIRTGFVLEEEYLVYKVAINPHGKTELPAGKLVFKD